MFTVYHDDSFGLNPRRQKGFAVAEDVLYEDAVKVGVVITSVFRVLKDPFLKKLCTTYNITQALVPTLLELGCLLSFKVAKELVLVDTLTPPWIDQSYAERFYNLVTSGLRVGFKAYQEYNSFETLENFNIDLISTTFDDYSLSDMFIEGSSKVRELYKLCPKRSIN